MAIGLKILRFTFFVLPFVLGGCGHAKNPSTMRHEKIFFTNELRVGVFDFDGGFDRSGLEACAQDFPSIKVVGETYVHRALAHAGINPEILAGYGEDFSSYESLSGFHLLLLTFHEGGQKYLRAVNYLGRYVSTVVLDIPKPRCEDILRAQRILAVESHPPLADVSLNGRKIGESPLWIWLRDGNYRVSCELPGQDFPSMEVDVPRDVHVLCRRENVESKAQVEEFHKMSGEEKAGSVLVYIVGVAAAVGAIILPFIFFL